MCSPNLFLKIETILLPETLTLSIEICQYLGVGSDGSRVLKNWGFGTSFPSTYLTSFQSRAIVQLLRNFGKVIKYGNFVGKVKKILVNLCSSYFSG